MRQTNAVSDPVVTADLLGRLDRLPMTRTARLTTVLLIVVWVAEGFEAGIIGPILLIVKAPWHLTSQSTAQLGVASTLGILVGAALAGRLADRYGRKVVLLCGITLFSVFAAACAVSSDIGWIMAMRALGGLALGAVFPIPYLLLSELLGKRSRASVIATASAMLALSYIIPQLAALAVIGNTPFAWSWRILFLIGGLPVLAIPFVHRYLPESPRWLLLNGRASQAQALVERMEREAGYEDGDGVVHSGTAGVVQAEYAAYSEPGHQATALLRQPLLGRFALSLLICAGATASGYVVVVYAPTLYAGMGLSNHEALLATAALIAGGVVGAMLVGSLADRLGRKKTFLIYSLGAVAGYSLLAISPNASLSVCFGILSAFFSTGMVPFSRLFTAEQFPTRTRGTAAGWVESIGRFIGGVLIAGSIPYVQTTWGTGAPFWIISAIFLVCLGPVMFRARETKGMSIDQAGAV
ncbi:MFS transporter, putative metabolite:H+ symporter [Streptomyces sp. 136MFCol5.1]|nr:MFS transporter, putative metabolite:H+ symporter [Streptomyces sp. 136MFCol5.1]SFT25141.1 MFS transporter, putative metabolite:H+ symporter [Streptomyces sp. ok210]